jgi:hypothetical protein
MVRRNNYTFFSFSTRLTLCLRSFRCIHPAHALSTTTVSSTVTIQYSEKPPIGSSRVDHSIIGIANSVYQESANVRSARSRYFFFTARKVPGRNTVVSRASAFIAAPSFIPAAAIMRPEMASRVVMKLYTCTHRLGQLVSLPWQKMDGF